MDHMFPKSTISKSASQYLRNEPFKETYTRSINAIVDPPKLLHRLVEHILHALEAPNICEESKDFEVRVGGVALGFFGGLAHAGLVDVGDDEAAGTVASV